MLSNYKMKKKYRTHKYETWLPERPKKTIIKEEEKSEQQKRNEKFDF